MAEATMVKLLELLTFHLGEEMFAAEVDHVREVLEFSDITRIPRTPDFMRGVINMRGSVVPIIDMRTKFNLPPSKETEDTCIIVIEVSIAGEIMVMGMLVDAVEEVIELEHDQIEPLPGIGINLDTEFIKGMGKKNGQFIIILDIDRVFSAEELSDVDEAVKEV